MTGLGGSPVGIRPTSTPGRGRGWAGGHEKAPGFDPGGFQFLLLQVSEDLPAGNRRQAPVLT